MATSEPSWWYRPAASWQATALSPIAAIYGVVAVRRFKTAVPFRPARPVVCVGNFTAGGTGKTPLSLALAGMLRGMGREPWFLTRGYAGRLAGPLRVDPGLHSAADVGDEPLLLAQKAHTVVARDRVAGAQLIAKIAPASAVIVMDDGLQNASLTKDLTIAVIDAKRSDGNGRVMPAGPLRAPLDFQFGLTDAILINGGGVPDGSAQLQSELDRFAGPVLSAKTKAAGEVGWLKDRPVVAYAGIANPARFFNALIASGAKLVATRAFADHAPFTEQSAATLLDLASMHAAQLVTTEKDYVRLAGASGGVGDLRLNSRVLAIELAFDAENQRRLAELLSERLE